MCATNSPRAGLVAGSSETGVMLCRWKEEPFQQHSPTPILPGQLGAVRGPLSSSAVGCGQLVMVNIG